MSIFNSNSPSYQQVPNNANATVTTSATQIYSTTSFVAVGNVTYTFPTGTVLSGITILNTGANTCWIGTSSLTGTAGVPLKPGEQLTVSNGNGHVSAESGTASWNLYAITASGTTTIEASLTTISVNE